MSIINSTIDLSSIPASFNILTAKFSPCWSIPSNICSVSIYSDLNLSANIPEISNISSLLGLSTKSIGIIGIIPFFSIIFPSIYLGVMPNFNNTLDATPSPSFDKPNNKCSLSTLLWPNSLAHSKLSSITFLDFCVNLLKYILSHSF